MTLPGITWTIAGQPAFLQDGWTCNAIAQGGFDRMQGVITEASWEAFRGIATQGSIVKGWVNGAEPLWEGRLATIPDIEGGQATIAAMGYRVKAEKKVDRLFIQSKDMGIWQPTEGEPHLNSSGNTVYDVYKKMEVNVGNRIRIRVPTEALALNARNGATFWAEGVNVDQIRFTMNYVAADENADLSVRVARANGPIGSSVDVSAYPCGSGNRNTTQTQSIGAVVDMVILYLEVNTAHTPGSVGAYGLTRCVVNSDVTTSDTFHAYQVIDHIGTTLGFDVSGIDVSTYNVLPFDFDGDWASAADYVAELEDFVWGVYDDAGNGPRMTYGDWGQTDWTCYLSHGAEADLSPLEVYNRAFVWYETAHGVRRREVALASPDPLEAAGITNTYEFDLEDRQGSQDVLAAAVAAKLAARFSRQRYSGKVTLFNAWDSAGRDHPYGIRPGDTLTIADWGAGESLTQRVVEVEYRHDRVEVGVERPINLVHIFEAARRRRRRRRR